jgi:hypothetical protein
VPARKVARQRDLPDRINGPRLSIALTRGVRQWNITTRWRGDRRERQAPRARRGQHAFAFFCTERID